MRVLGIESSCDETAAAVVDDGEGRPRLMSSIVHSQVASHARFGGVVPEVASREHIGRIVEIVDQAVRSLGDGGGDGGGIASIDAIACTRGPGLVGSLLVGMQFAKGLALARGIRWLGINHLEGHLSAALLEGEPLTYPHVALVVSGGHTHLYEVAAFGVYRLLGHTRDDAAGEAFDKVAKILGLGYPGGVAIDRMAQDGDGDAVALPRGMASLRTFDFSFSGLKTAAREHVQRQGELRGAALRDFCASLQEAIADVLSKKTVAAAKRVRASGVVLAGGVAANSRLRQLVQARCERAGLWAFLPPKELCTDNAAMIAAAGWMRLRAGERSPWSDSARSRWPLEA